MAAALVELFLNMTRKDSQKQTDKRSAHIFYKIVEKISEFKYKLQCINTKAVFESDVNSIVFDNDILYGLHPVQSCLIGIEYAKLLKIKDKSNTSLKYSRISITESCITRYGSYSMRYQNRSGNICFVDLNTHQESIMDPRDIALSEELIGEFDAIQAFHVGILAGIKLNNSIKTHTLTLKPNLSIVK